MGLLDSGVFDSDQFRLGMGLLAAGGARSDGANTGQRLQEALGGLDAYKQNKLRQKMVEMQMAEQQSQIEQARGLREAASSSFRSPDMANAMSMGPAMGGGVVPQVQPGFDHQSYINRLYGMGAVPQAVAHEQAVKKDNTPIKLGAGDTLVSPTDYKTLFTAPTAPKEASPTELSRLIGEMNSLPQGSPMRSVYENQIRKMTTHAPGVSVTYGAPVAGVDQSGNPVYFQPSKDGAAPSIIQGVSPPPKEVPAAIKSALAQNDVTIGKIDKAIKAVDSFPGSFGLQNFMGDAIQQRLDPNGVEPRAFVADIAGQKIHDRSGAAVTVGESERLKPYVPNANDHPETVKKKLKLFRAEYSAMQQALQSGATIAQASSKPSEPPPAPMKGMVRNGYKFKGGDPANQANWEKQ